MKDIKNELFKIKSIYPKKKIFLLGESMGGAIVISLASSDKKLPIDGIVMLAPAIWNFTEKNFLKSYFMNFFSRILPNLQVESKGWVDVQASDNIEMLKELAKDKFFIHKPNLRSLYGVITLMDKSYKNAREFFIDTTYNTLLIVPLRDEIVPRKPLIELLEKINIKNKLDLLVYESSYHMILRDINGYKIANDIKDWMLGNLKKTQSLESRLDLLKNSEFYHILD